MEEVGQIKYESTICPYYTSGCGIYLVVKNGRIIGEEPRKDYPLNEGKTCIKCYGCRDACPLYHCKRCVLESDVPDSVTTVTKGIIPPSFTFGLTRVLHVACNCVNCGQCEDVCAADITLSKLAHNMNNISSRMFKYDAGLDVNAKLPLCAIPEEEKRLESPKLQYR